jgi:hypothetical protein
MGWMEKKNEGLNGVGTGPIEFARRSEGRGNKWRPGASTCFSGMF